MTLGVHLLSVINLALAVVADEPGSTPGWVMDQDNEILFRPTYWLISTS
jgi:hypothetical protein